jgi:hypothetical protein
LRDPGWRAEEAGKVARRATEWAETHQKRFQHDFPAISTYLPVMGEPDLEFYNKHYGFLPVHLTGERMTVGRAHPRRCRFCGKQGPDVTFLKEAHALPEMVGNKTLFSLHECDACNELFGRTIEYHFGRWTGFQRTTSAVTGKNGVPQYQSKDGNVQWDVGAEGANIVFKGDIGPVKVDVEGRKVTISGEVQPYIPRFAYKCLVKMALSVMPEEDVAHFAYAFPWLREVDPAKDRHPGGFFRVMQSFTNGFKPFRWPTYILLRRKNDGDEIPHYSFVLAWGNYSHQIFIPFSAKDAHLRGRQITLPPFPNLYESDPARKVTRWDDDLGSLEKTEVKVQTVTYHMDSIVEKPITPAPETPLEPRG